MPPKLRHAFDRELRCAVEHYRAGRLDPCFRHLERAHILGQRSVIPHARSHWWMLKVGLRRRDGREIRGQLLRLVAGTIGSAIGRVPLGNTGGADVSPVRPMPIPDDLRAYFD